MHDENYKRIFAFPRVIEDLLRGFVPGAWLEEVDFATLGKLSTEYNSDELIKRHGDNVWRMRLRKNWLYLLLLVEFQSTDDPLMALRIHTYTGLLYQELARNDQLDADGRLRCSAGAAAGAVQRRRAVGVAAADGGADRAGGAVAGAVSTGAALLRA